MRDRDRRGWLRGTPPPGWVRALPAAMPAGVCVATLATHPTGPAVTPRSRRGPAARQTYDGSPGPLDIPLLDRLVEFSGDDPAVPVPVPLLAERVWAGLGRRAPALQDDVTMLVLAPGAPEAR